MTDALPRTRDTEESASRPDGLSEAKRQLLDRWLAGAARPQAIPRRPAGGPVAATRPQRRMWVHAKLHPGTAAYNIGQAVRLTGPLDRDALRATLAELLRRHDALRTTFTEIDGLPHQVVADRLEPPLAYADSGGDRAVETGWLAALDTAPFDLGDGPLIRFGLLRHTDDEHLLMTVVHHAVADGLSLGILLRELRGLYTAFSAGRPSPLPEPRLAFADYAHWRDAREAGPEHAEQVAAWRRALGDEQPRLDLPTDRPRPAVPGSRGVSHRFTLAPAAWSAVRALARRHEATPYMAAVTALTALLHRYTGQRDIAVGSVVHGRERPELEECVGCFADTVVLRTAVDGDTAFGELLDRVRATCHDAYARQDVSLDVLAAELRWDRSPGAGPVPQVLAVMQNPPEAADFAGLRAEPVEQEVDSARFDLVLNCWEADGTLHGAITGNTDLYDAGTVARYAAHLVRLLESVAADGAAATVADLEILPAEERELLRRWGRPAEGDDPLVGRDLAGLVRDAARRDPAAVAVECGTATLTYAGLEARAEALAARLRGAGVGPETLVGVLLDRSVELVVALLAVLKAEGAFVPLEVSWPAARVWDIADRCGLRLVVGEEAAELLLAGSDIEVLRPGGAGSAGGTEPAGPAGAAGATGAVTAVTGTAAAPAEVPDAPVDMERLAYVIHTSGSTGTPKGVMIRQQAVCNRMLWQIGKLGLRADDAVLHKAPLGFDISVNEIFLPLVAGARLVVAEPGGDGDVDRLLTTIQRHRVTFLYIVASMLDVLLERDDAAARIGSLRHLWCGGEALTPDLYGRFRRVSDARMYHGYGPAETTIGVSCRVFEPGEPAEHITIGRPNPNTRLYVLDAAFRPVPIGVRGELHVGGLPLARGYLGDPERTAESFVADPYADSADGRMYRTGDLARFRADGEIEFLGRLDDQVKIRGFRVEPGEVAAVLARHPRVRQSSVVARAAAGGGHELIGYCSVTSGPAQDPAEAEGEALRGWLGGLLPAHAVPRAVVVLPDLPLTGAGKVDRKALAAVPLPAPDGAGAYTVPAPGIQDGVARIWAEVLETGQVGAHDNFFDLGGHSLLVIRVQTLIRQRLGHEVPLLALFGNATVARLAAYIESAGGAGTDRAAPAVAAESDARARALRGREALSRRRSRRPGPPATGPEPADRPAAEQPAGGRFTADDPLPDRPLADRTNADRPPADPLAPDRLRQDREAADRPPAEPPSAADAPPGRPPEDRAPLDPSLPDHRTPTDEESAR
ncbi:non-ribosomal peptide synthetase [Actinacidiphila sp. ITFR-21]|uniref:non-ribosomal peptide synthetase n=1 Tax=Actinacidiphila sp. ITFR-21 TaxID=3075199 RepID=UPI00288AD65B|nr:amino acid adenylation domain-containing protein [Streptomyces sp. ITFR-21]WNI18928.1 amino acid adenylation domain-containing protein [Streptomyces sp. ITFR-21]